MAENGDTGDGERGGGTVQMPVLLVKYGTFSLTLEGFEDPFGAMREVAEYFRAVLAEDRTFGALPGAPRTESLRHFAERRTGRAVEARVTRGQVHLRSASGAPARAAGAEALFDEEAAPETEIRVEEVAGQAATLANEGDDLLTEALEEGRADALPEDEAPTVQNRRSTLPAEADEAALERLISQTDSALAGAEARRRHATFAQLKAAVAATRAEGNGRRLPGQTAAEIARYRDVLTQSVGSASEPPARRARPDPTPEVHSPARDEGPPSEARATGPQTRSSTGTPPTDAPLILMAARRTGNGGEISRRRLEPRAPVDALFAEGAGAAESQTSGFAQFLSMTEPAAPGDLIDAAAAYLAHVEGLEDFPRPQIMRLIAPQLGGEPREEVMRAFGILLREGRLRRSRRGQFQSGERSNYAAAARRFHAGG
jgi:hypothetical protein